MKIQLTKKQLDQYIKKHMPEYGVIKNIYSMMNEQAKYETNPVYRIVTTHEEEKGFNLETSIYKQLPDDTFENDYTDKLYEPSDWYDDDDDNLSVREYSNKDKTLYPKQNQILKKILNNQ